MQQVMLFLAFGFPAASASAQSPVPSQAATVSVCIFWSPQCGSCEPVTEEAFERLGRQLGLRIQPTYVDIDRTENYERLVRIEQLMGVECEDLPVVLVGAQLIGGEPAIKKKMRSAIEVVARTKEAWPEGIESILTEKVSTLTAPADSPKSYGVYFTLAQCKHCRRSDHVVRYLRATMPQVEIRVFDNHDLRTRVLQEALEERVGVPVAQRGRQPRLIVGDKTLGEAEITDVKAMALCRDTQTGETFPWIITPEEERTARRRLTRLFDSFTLGAVTLGGLLDGVNPCAFAVIVFFVSYLAALGRARGEILAIGFSFIAAVFLTYFAIGLGLSELLGFLSGVSWLGRAVSFAVAALALFLAGASFYDLGLVLRGRMNDVVLQLPGAVKRRINLTLSRRVGGAYRDSTKAASDPNVSSRRWAVFISLAVAAFVSGVIVSVLELACTGQIYVPVLRMMLFDASGHRVRALAYLLVYNLAFTMPLLGVFILAYAGITSEQLRGWLTKHLALTKAATGIFFAFLCALILVIEFR